MNTLALQASDVEDGQERDGTQYVTLKLGKEAFGFPMNLVLEIIRLPETINVPLTPSALKGLANLRGTILPILDLRAVLEMPVTEATETTRVVVANFGVPIGLVVDRVMRVVVVQDTELASASGIQSSINADLLSGVIKGDGKEPITQILSVQELIEKEFADFLTPKNQLDHLSPEQFDEIDNAIDEAGDDSQQLVSFMLSDQEFAFDLHEVQEIVRVPEEVAEVPKTEGHVLGIMNLRGALLPLVALRRLFDMGSIQFAEDNRILVINIKTGNNGRSAVGLVVDQVREVLRISPEFKDSVPALLNLGGESDEIASVCRLEKGKRLVSILHADALIKHPSVQEAIVKNESQTEEESMGDDLEDTDLENDDTIQLVIFQLSGQEYGVSIEYVQEITRIPEKMDKVPKTPAFVEGVVNLRGTVLPVMDMRCRFDLEKMESNDRQRIIVLNMNGMRTGFIVDLVSEVLRLEKDQIEPSPTLSNDQARVMGEVVNLKDAKRMIQLLTVDQLLSKQEITAISA